MKVTMPNIQPIFNQYFSASRMLSRIVEHFLTYSKFGPYLDALLLRWVKK